MPVVLGQSLRPVVVFAVWGAMMTLQLGCTEKLNVRTDDPGAAVRIDGRDVGPVGKAGKTVEVSLVGGNVPYEVIPTEGEPYAGEIERDHVSWWLVVPAIMLPFCLAPGCAACAVVTVNPTSVYGLALSLLSGGLGGAAAALSLPTWWTLPCMAGAVCASSAPLSSLFAAERTPDYVLITKAGAEPIDKPQRKSSKKKRREKKNKKKRRKKSRRGDVEESAYLPQKQIEARGVLY